MFNRRTLTTCLALLATALAQVDRIDSPYFVIENGEPSVGAGTWASCWWCR